MATLILDDIQSLIQKATTGYDEFEYLGDYVANADMFLYSKFGRRRLAKWGKMRAENDFTELKELYEEWVASILSSEEYHLKTLISTVTAEFDPVSNYDMAEEETINRDESSSSDSDLTEQYGDRTIINSKWAYDKSGAAPDNKSESSQEMDLTESSMRAKGNEKVVRTLTRKGNIGATTASQMLQEVRELADMNIAETIADIVASRITIQIWDTEEAE